MDINLSDQCLILHQSSKAFEILYSCYDNYSWEYRKCLFLRSIWRSFFV